VLNEAKVLKRSVLAIVGEVVENGLSEAEEVVTSIHPTD
jgi:hypothetical protein